MKRNTRDGEEHIPSPADQLLVEYLLTVVHRRPAKRGGAQEALHVIKISRLQMRILIDCS